MTILIIALTLFSFTVNAQISKEVKPSKSGLAGYTLEGDEAAIEKSYKKICKKSSWLKCKVNDKSKDALFSEIEKYTEEQDLGKTQSVADAEGNISKVPLLETVELERTIYYHPDNFTIVDKSQELADKKAEQEARKVETKLIKEMKHHVDNSNLPEWHKLLLKRLIKNMKE